MGFPPLIFSKIPRQIMANPFRNSLRNFTSTTKRYDAKKDEPCTEDVIFKTFSGGKASIELNRAKQLNTLNVKMVCQVREKLLEWRDDKYLILLKGAGDKAFCAGGDVVAVTKDKCGAVGKKFFREEYKLDALISTLRVPFCSLMKGIVMGGGVGISRFGKPRVATETSMFAMPETQIGFFPDVGISYHLARMPKNLGMFLALTGYRLKGYDLVHAEIATHYCTMEHLKKLEDALLCDFFKTCCVCPNDTLREYKEKSLKSFPNGEPPPFSLKEHLDSIDCWFKSCTLEEVMQKLEADKSKFAKDTLDCLKKMSPLSLKVTFKQIKEAANLNVFDCFNVDYRIAMKMMTCGDFVEGKDPDAKIHPRCVRALLIDKDKKPKWKHESVCKVTDEEVNNFFCALSPEEELNLPDSLYECCEE